MFRCEPVGAFGECQSRCDECKRLVPVVSLVTRGEGEDERDVCIPCSATLAERDAYEEWLSEPGNRSWAAANAIAPWKV